MGRYAAKARWVVSIAAITGCSFDVSGAAAAVASEGGVTTTTGDGADPGAVHTTSATGTSATGPTTAASDLTTSNSSLGASVTTTDLSGDSIAAPPDATTTGEPGAATAIGSEDDTPAAVSLGVTPFGNVPLGAIASRALTVHNTGGSTAYELGLWVAEPFALGAPGCPDALPAGKTCITELVLPAGPGLGPVEASVHATFNDDETTTASVSANVIGAIAGLIPDGSFEACPRNAPPGGGWSDTTNGEWRCVDASNGITPVSGQRMVAALNGAANFPYRLEHDVDVRDHASAIATGTMEFTVSAWARTAAFSADFFRLTADYLDAERVLLWHDSSGFISNPQSWLLWEERSRAPAGTAFIQVTLSCSKGDASRCDAYFDDVRLTGSYGLD